MEKIDEYNESYSGGTIVDNLHRNANGDLLAAERHYFYGTPIDEAYSSTLPTIYSSWKTSREYKTESLNISGGSTGAALRRAEMVWYPSSSPNLTVPPPNPKLTETITTLVDSNQVSKTSSIDPTTGTIGFDQYNNQTDIWEHDYGTGAPGSPIRQTHIDYLTSGYDTISGGVNNPDPAATIHIRNLPTQQIVRTAGGTQMSLTTYEYDNYSGAANHAALVNRGNITGLVSRSGLTPAQGYTPTGDLLRGNATQVTKWLSVPAGDVKSWAQYDIAGNVVKTIDSNQNATIIDFSDRFGAPDDDARLNTAPSPNWLGSQSTFAFPTKITNALGHEAYTQYDYFLGRPVNTEDANGVVSSLAYSDSLDRLTQAIEARYKVGSGIPTVRRQKSFVYDDVNRTITSTGDRDLYGDNILTGRAYYDGLGRTWRTAAFEGNTGSGNTWSISDTVFDALGRVRQVSNPFRAADPATATAPSGTWTTTTYDALSRVITVQTPDTAIVTTAYSGNVVTVTDQTGRQRRSMTDVLGRLTRVDEPSGCNTCLGSVSSPLQPTSYVYDVLDNLRRVQQGSQNRYFMYDSLSRLIRAKNVEQTVNSGLALSDPVTGNSQWSIKYEYDANGNLWKKTDARNVLTTYGYDSLNRNTSVSYNDGATAGLNRYYDGAIANGKGRLHYSLSYNSHPVSGYAYSIDQVTGYDPMGRVLSRQQGFLNSAGTQWHYYPVSRTYNLAGGATSQTYPSGRSVNYGYDAAGRLSSFTGTLGDGGSRNYATGIRYTAAGLMSRETFGMQSATLYHNLHYNNRQQLVDIRVGDDINDDWNWSRGALIYYYGTAARDSWNAFANSPDNNGNVLRQVNYAPLIGGGYVHPQLDDYSYDSLNRITSVTEAQLNSSGAWTFNLFTQNFLYDRWGNRTVWCSPGQPGVTCDTFTIDTATNRITAKNGYPMTYDLAGNQANDVTGSRWFDGENRMYKAQQGGTTSHYVYDADGRRVRRIVGSTETWQVYGMEGELIAEYNVNGSPSSPQKEYGYRGGQMLIVAQTSPLEVRWLVTDHLGTPRMNIRGTGSDGGSLTSVTRHDYLPFGEEAIAGIRRNGSNGQYGYEPPPDGVRQKFTGYERDTETALDYAQARYHSSVQGRFTSPDLPFADQYEHDPQSWNLYAYVRNNPCSNNDPTGRNTCYFRKDGSKIGCEGDTRIKIATGGGQGTITRTDKDGKPERLSLDDVKAVTYASTATNPTAELAFEMNRYAPALNRFGAVGGSIALGVVGLPAAGLAGGNSLVALGISNFPAMTNVAGAGTPFAVLWSSATGIPSIANAPNAIVLRISPYFYQTNMLWLRQIVSRRIPVYVGSALGGVNRMFNEKGNIKVFGDEVYYLVRQGFSLVQKSSGYWLIPPGK
ncbi:MAG: RHS repeat protein [Acidobacteriota bacterium]|nr:MAG: RHS repeat protein [Acidobacteriota bacterium]